MSPEFLYWLQVSSLVFFNIFCIKGIILGVSLWRTSVILRNKATNIADEFESQVSQFSKKSYNLISDISNFAIGSFFNRNRRKW